MNRKLLSAADMKIRLWYGWVWIVDSDVL